MSYMGWIPPQSGGTSPVAWRSFPGCHRRDGRGGRGQAGMVYAALHTFPASAGDEVSICSNQLRSGPRAGAAEANLAGRARARPIAAPVLTLTDRYGVAAGGRPSPRSAERPLGARECAAGASAKPLRPLCRRHGCRAGPMGSDIVGVRRRHGWQRHGGSWCGDCAAAFPLAGDFRSLPRSPAAGRRSALRALRPARPAGRRFCCPGCAAAFETIQSSGSAATTRSASSTARRAPRPEAGRALGSGTPS